MPRIGSSCTDRVCRVPKETSLRMVASIRLGSTSRRIARSSGAGEGLRRSAASASPGVETPAARVAADTVRNVRPDDLATPPTLLPARRHVYGCRCAGQEEAEGTGVGAFWLGAGPGLLSLPF